MRTMAMACGGALLLLGSARAFVSSHGDPRQDFHGHRVGTGFSGQLVPPMARGDTLRCADCHAPHDPTNGWSLRRTVNGRPGLTVTDGNSVKVVCGACHQGGAADWHQTCVTQCHADPAPGDNHPGFGLQNIPGDGAPCLDCHGHGRDFTHTGTCLDCHGTVELGLLGIQGPYTGRPFVPWTYHAF